MKDNILVNAKISRLFLKFVVPSVISMVLVGIQSMVDGIFLGKFENSNAMASVNIAGPYMQIILGCSFILCTGALSCLGRAIGAKDIEQTKNIFKTAVISIAASSCLIMILGIVSHNIMARFFGANEVLVSDSSRYILIIAFFSPIISLMVFFGFMERLIEKPHIYLIATVVSLICNVMLNYMLIKVLKLGVTGAALATGLSYFIGLLIVSPAFFMRRTIVNIHVGKFRQIILKQISLNGSSEGVNYLATALILFLFNRALMRYSGEDGVAAFTVINYIGNFTTVVMFGISDGIGSIISCNFGAGETNRVRKTLQTAIIVNFLLGAFVFALLRIYSQNLVNIFVSDNPQVAEIAVRGAEIYSIGFLFNGYNIIQSGYHTSLGNAISSAIIAASRGIFFVVIGIAVLPLVWELNGVWLTLPFAEVMTVGCCLLINYQIKNKALK